MGLDLQRFLSLGSSLGQVALEIVGRPQVAVARKAVGGQADAALEGRDCRGDAAGAQVERTQDVVELAVGAQGDRTLKRGFRQVELRPGLVQGTEGVLGIGVPRFELDRLFDLPLGLVQTPERGVDQSQAHPGRRQIAVERHGPLGQRQGLVQPHPILALTHKFELVGARQGGVGRRVVGDTADELPEVRNRLVEVARLVVAAQRRLALFVQLIRAGGAVRGCKAPALPGEGQGEKERTGDETGRAQEGSTTARERRAGRLEIHGPRPSFDKRGLVRRRPGCAIGEGRSRHRHSGGGLFEAGGNLAGIPGPGVRLLFEQPLDQRGELGGDLRAQSPRRQRAVVANAGQGVRGGGGAKRRLSGEHLVEQRAQREEVRAGTERQPQDLLGRHGVARAHHHPRVRERCFLLAPLGRQRPRDAEVEDLGVTRRGDHHVGRLEIAMQDALRMGGGEPAGDLAPPLYGASYGEKTFGEELAKRLAYHQLHDEPVAFRRFHQVVDLDHGRMGEPGPGLGLAAEALARPRLIQNVRQDMFDRHRPLQPPIPGAPDLSHAAGREPLDEAVGPDRFRRRLFLQAHGGLGEPWRIGSRPSCFIRRRIPASETCSIAAISR